MTLSAYDSLIDQFLASVQTVIWLCHAGNPYPNGLVVPDVATAWDDWNPEMMSTWSPRTHKLETRARRILGDPGIDGVFNRIGSVLHEPIREGLQSYFDHRPNVNANTRCGADLSLWPELLDTIKRDVAWAAIETLLGEPGFFVHMLAIYREGRWPCAWQGNYPSGSVVVL
jgi:hypothetical protein